MRIEWVRLGFHCRNSGIPGTQYVIGRGCLYRASSCGALKICIASPELPELRTMSSIGGAVKSVEAPSFFGFILEVDLTICLCRSRVSIRTSSYFQMSL